jgi:hypothetical protein
MIAAPVQTRRQQRQDGPRAPQGRSVRINVRFCALVIASVVPGLLSGCSPIYSYRLPTEAQAALDPAGMRGRLETFLLGQGYQALGRSDQATANLERRVGYP